MNKMRARIGSLITTKLFFLGIAIAMLEISPVDDVLAQNSTQTGDAFEVVSVKASGPLPPGTRIMFGGPVDACPVRSVQLDPQHFTASRVSTLRLITWAYGIGDCRPELGLVSAGPDWAHSDLFDVQAALPEGTPSYSRQQLDHGEAVRLEAMLQTMLRDRFKLAVHRESVEMPVLKLVVAKPGKMQPAKDQGPPDPNNPPGRNGTMLVADGLVQGTSIPFSMVVAIVQRMVELPVVDKTGLTGSFDIRIPVEIEHPSIYVLPPETLPQVLTGFGLKLESGRAAVQVLAIDRVEKPVEN
jgi:uncharacterized protein (TIGR03435 family)